MLRQIEFGLFDLLLHSEFDARGNDAPPRSHNPLAAPHGGALASSGRPSGGKTVLQLLDDVRQEVAVVVPPEWNRFPHSFSHIFGGGYGAGYYSYKWAEVLSSDAFGAFEEAAARSGSALDAATGERFRREILAVGGSRPAMESFRAFRGREPHVDALLRHSG